MPRTFPLMLLSTTLLFVATSLWAADDPPPVEVAPVAGAPVIARGPPSWCGGATIALEDPSISQSTPGMLMRNADRWSMLRRMAEHSCRAPDLESRQAWSQAWRQTVANRTGADAGLIERLFEFVLANDDTRIEALKKEACAAIEVPPRTSRAGQGVPGPMRVRKQSESVALGCQDNLLEKLPEIRIEEQLYWLDRGPELDSELARAVLILRELDFDVSYQPDALGARAVDRLPGYALVAHDLGALDAGKLRAEVKQLGTNAYGELLAEILLARAQLQGRRYAALIGEMDPTVADLAGAASAGYDEWVRTYRANEAPMKRAYQLEDRIIGGEDGEIRPCHDEAHAAFVAYARPAAKRAKDLDTMKAALRDSFARALLGASMVCAAFEGKAAIASGLYLWDLNEGEHVRGPRVASYSAMLERYAELASSDSRLGVPATKLKRALDFPSKSWVYRGFAARANNQAGAQGPQDGQIASVSPTKGGLKLTFETVRWNEPILGECVRSKRINYISFTGTVHYYQDCKKLGSEPRSSTLKPVIVPASMAVGLRAGQFVTLLVEENAARSALPLAVYDTPRSRKLLGRLGVMK